MTSSMGPDGVLHSRTKIACDAVSVFYQEKQALSSVSLEVPDQAVTALIGPSGSGKSSFLRCINRMNDTVRGARVEGQIRIDGLDVYAANVDPVSLRTRVGMVFQNPSPFPKSVFENVAYGLRIHGMTHTRPALEDAVQRALIRVGLWDEVKDDLSASGTSLSGGQQQRLCIARAIAIEPEIILMDEPCSALDPIITARIEELIDDLRRNYCMVIVTHSCSKRQDLLNIRAS